MKAISPASPLRGPVRTMRELPPLRSAIARSDLSRRGDRPTLRRHQVRERLTAGVDAAVLAERDHALNQRAGGLGLGHGGVNAVVDDDGCDEVAKQGAAMAGVATGTLNPPLRWRMILISFDPAWAVGRRSCRSGIRDQWPGFIALDTATRLRRWAPASNLPTSSESPSARWSNSNSPKPNSRVITG